MPVNPAARRAIVRLGQIALTFVVFAVFNRIGSWFELWNNVSILYPASAVAIVATMMFGAWAAVGVVLGTMVTPWNPAHGWQTLAISGAVVAVEGLIPWAVFRLRKDLTADLRDMKSFVAFLLFGTVINSAVSALAGNLLVIAGPLRWREVFVWFIADFTAAMLIATPVLAFGGALLDRSSSDRPRTITNALQIVTVVILLGFVASFAIRTYLLDRLEDERTTQQEQWYAAQETLNRMHSNFIRAGIIDPADAMAATKLDAARSRHAAFIGRLTPLLSGASPELRRELPAIAAATGRWFDDARARLEGRATPRQTEWMTIENGRYILALRGMMDRANARQWGEYTAARRKIMLVSTIVDGMVFLILIGAAVMLLYAISRPFAQLRAGIVAMRHGEPLDARQIDGRYVEFRDVAETLEETSRELLRREEALRLQTEKAMTASRHKSDFLAKMSHELRTPLNSIIGFSDLLAEQESTITTEKRLGFLRNVAGSAKHLLKLINDLLDIAKVESGKMKLQLERLDLRTSIANTVASTQPLFVRKKQEVEIVTPDEPMLVRADPGRIEQVLLNLLSNANKFSGEGQKITIRGDRESAMWRIDVADHGIGISPEDQSRIFDEFEQVASRGMHSDGTGLGLALARRFVEAHGGEISVESALGGGAVFSVRLPRGE